MEIVFRCWYQPEQKMYYRAYQKLSYLLLCDDDQGQNAGQGTPSIRVSYDDCDLMQSTTVLDKHGREVFEGDIVRIKAAPNKNRLDLVDDIPDMYKSRGMHPCYQLLKRSGIDQESSFEIEVVGNKYEDPELLENLET